MLASKTFKYCLLILLGLFAQLNAQFIDQDSYRKNLLMNPAATAGAKSLVHPHIWVSPSDRQDILDNIAKHSWASSLKDQLVERHASRFINHTGNPSNEIAAIPAIPGDRTTHRDRLNIGAECAILYFITEDERYAQIAADILHQYVKLISVKDPLTFEFYTTNFNHLIQCRELFTRVAMIYDFVQPFISTTGKTVYDLESNTQVSFDFDKAQKSFEVMAQNVISVGGNNSNHPVLELPGGLYSVMCMEDDAVRASFFDKLMNGASNSKQPGVNWMLSRFSPEERLWPESAGYGKFTHALFIQIMNILDRYNPNLNIISNNKDLIESIFIYENFLYPNGATMAYGDTKRDFSDHEHIFRTVMEIADRKGYTDLRDRAATTLKKIYTKDGGYTPVIETQRLEWDNPLQLLWGHHIEDSVSDVGELQYGTVKATHAGVVMQRNFVENNNEQHGLMYYTGGGTYVHAHASGLDMELYGAGYVIGPDFGSDTYGADIHEQYAVSYAAHNTVIVNGSSGRGPKTNGNSTWQNIVDPIVLEASEPAVYASPIAENFSFSTQFLDDNQNNVDQQRTNSIVRTSPTSGYYVDIFRSFSNATNNFHDYLFHGLGDALELRKPNENLPLTDTPNRYQNDVGDSRKQPGWRWFSNTKTSASTNSPVAARFHLQHDDRYLHISTPGGIDKEFSSALAPPAKEVKNGYAQKDTQMFIMRKYGEAWDKPFVAVYEPSLNASATVKATKHIYYNNKVVGVEVISIVDGVEIKDVILSNPTASDEITLYNYDISFTGRFAIVRTVIESGKTDVSLYVGAGNSLTFNDKILTADSDGKAYLEYSLDYPYSRPVNPDNFTIETISETCINSSNGIVNITAEIAKNYVVTLNGKEYAFTNSIAIDGLAPGTYEMCISVAEEAFSQCHEYTISQGVRLAGQIRMTTHKSASVSVTQGAAPFTVIKNGIVLFETNDTNFMVPVVRGDNLVVKSSADCQGILSENIDLFEIVNAFPNPSFGKVEIEILTELKRVPIEVFDVQSKLILSSILTVNNKKIMLDLSSTSPGLYFVKIKLDKPRIIKVIKK